MPLKALIFDILTRLNVLSQIVELEVIVGGVGPIGQPVASDLKKGTLQSLNALVLGALAELHTIRKLE